MEAIKNVAVSESISFNYQSVLAAIPLMNNDPVKEYKALVRKPRHEEALQLLKRLASQVKPVLLKHNWTIKSLVEFFPKNPHLLGNEKCECVVPCAHPHSRHEHQQRMEGQFEIEAPLR